jgi:methylated-DNA-[protein]-cysteine S-methyltransferase
VTRFATFDTSPGQCAIAWRGNAVVGVALPASSPDALIDHMRTRFAGAEEDEPPEQISALIDKIVRLLSGEAEEFGGATMRFEETSAFERRVYAETLAIPLGETRTYGQIAAALREPGAARAVGRALGRNPLPILVPCHRVLAADGRSGGFSAPGGVSTKMRLLSIERARRTDQPSLFDLDWAARP